MEIKEVENLAKLCRIELKEEEKKSFSKEISSILNFIEQIQEVEIENFNSDTGFLKNVMREDEAPYEGGLFTDVLLAEAPERQDNYVKVKKIF